jgi:YidC/Oxa1 family membrane protein insertase
MDRKSIILLIICFLLMISWPVLVNKIYPPKPLPPGATNGPSAALSFTNQAGTSAPAPPILEAATAPPPTVTSTNEREQLVEITNVNAHYTFSSYGGGLKMIELLKYPETVSTRGEKQPQTNRVATLNTLTPAPTLSVLDGPAVQGDGVFILTTPTTNRVHAEKTLTNGLTVIKDFVLSTNYLVLASVRLENHSAQPLALPAQEWFAGTATPMNPRDDGSAVGLMWYNGGKSQDVLGSSFFSTRGFACTPRVPPPEYRAGDSNVFWVAVHNQFFALATMATPADPAWQVVMRKVDLPRPSLEEVANDSRIVRQPMGYTAGLVYPALNLAPHQMVERRFTVYAGPKEYRTLATISSTLNNNVDLIMGFGGTGLGAFFGFFSKALLLFMNTLHQSVGLPYGWAIIAVTVILKAVFWPLTQASARSAKRMQALQPQVKIIQDKYKDDPVKVQRKMMELWKENKVSPMSGCLPTLIQMPVFIGFFYMIRSAIELRGASFLWIQDLSKPDTLFLIPGINFPFNFLPLIMGATMLWQARLTPPSPGMDPAQAKIMRYMPLMFMVFLYSFSAGLTLYWTVQNLLSILQTKLIRNIGDPVPPAQAPVLTPPPKKRK